MTFTVLCVVVVEQRRLLWTAWTKGVLLVLVFETGSPIAQVGFELVR